MTDIVQIFTSWPVPAMATLGIFLFLFRIEIRSLFARIRKVSKDGFEADAGSPGRQEKIDEEKVKSFLKLGDLASLINQENLLRKELQNAGLEYQGKSIDVLIRQLAVSQMVVHFQSVYETIFGSQIILLKNLQRMGPIKIEKLAADFDEMKIQAQYKQISTWNFPQYTHYLLGMRLVINSHGNLEITPTGIDFLVWMIRAGKAEEKPN